MKRIRKLLGMAVAFAFALAILPATALAVDEYDLHVNGEQFTSEKLTIDCGEGTATYDPATQNLTLNNATITKATMSGGIYSMLSNDLTITLQGNNQITLENNLGAIIKSNLKIEGPGTLTINVTGDTQDGITCQWGSVDIMNATLVINASGGIGISAYGTVRLDNVNLTANGLYAGIDALNLIIANGSDVKLSAKQDYCNAAYIAPGDDQTGGGSIYVNNSNVVAESPYPGLFAHADLAIDGGSVKATSATDSAIWARGDLTIHGGAKVELSGMYPSGCNGTFRVGLVDIDAKNTNQENIPAIADNPVILDDFTLKTADAVDSEGTAIDLIEHDGVEAAKGYLNLYKNIHFTTGDAIVSYGFPFEKRVVKGGDIAPGQQEFELEIFYVGAGTIENYADVTITGKVMTNGAETYEGRLTIEGPKDKVRNLTSEGFLVREKNTAVPDWTYSDAVYMITCYEIEITDYNVQSGNIVSDYTIMPAHLVVTDNGEFYEPVPNADPVRVMEFENVYTKNNTPGGDPGDGDDPNKPKPGEGDKPGDGDKPKPGADDKTKPAADGKTIPQTGDNAATLMGVAVLLMAACVSGAVVLAKRTRKE